MLGAALLAAAAAPWQPAGAAPSVFVDAGGSVSIDANHDLVLSGARLENAAGFLSLKCPLTRVHPPSGTTLEWSCSGGRFSLRSSDGSTAVSGSFRTGRFTLVKSGGGIGRRIRYRYTFSGAFDGTLTTSGRVEPITGETTQSLAVMKEALGTGTIRSGKTFVHPATQETARSY